MLATTTLFFASHLNYFLRKTQRVLLQNHDLQYNQPNAFHAPFLRKIIARITYILSRVANPCAAKQKVRLWRGLIQYSLLENLMRDFFRQTQYSVQTPNQQP